MIGDLDDEPHDENHKKTCSDSFYKPYLDAQDEKDIYEIIDREYSLILVSSRHNISNPDELCRTEVFTVVRYSMGLDEEFVAVGPIEEPLEACIASTTTSSTKRIADGPIAEVEIARTSSNFHAGPCCKRNRLNGIL
ncbi:hypothetical protein Tco_0689567 [Tanacetum coccineum]